MAFSIKWLSNLKIYEDHRGKFVDFERFYELLKCEHKPTDKTLKKFNIDRDLKKDAIYVTLNEKQFVSVQSVLRFIFQHANEFYICKAIANEIQRSITGTKQGESSTIDLYNKIVKADYWKLLFETGLSSSIKVKEEKAPFLCDIHERDFSEAD